MKSCPANCHCEKCRKKSSPSGGSLPSNPLIEGEDYVLENGLLVFTRKYHLKRGFCCNSGCRHCPYKK